MNPYENTVLSFSTVQNLMENGHLQLNRLNLNRSNAGTEQPVVEPKKIAQLFNVPDAHSVIHQNGINLISPSELPTPPIQQLPFNTFYGIPNTLPLSYLQKPELQGIRINQGLVGVQTNITNNGAVPTNLQQMQVKQAEIVHCKKSKGNPVIEQRSRRPYRKKPKSAYMVDKNDEKLEEMMNKMQKSLLANVTETLRQEFATSRHENNECSQKTENSITDLHQHTMAAVATNLQVLETSMQNVQERQETKINEIISVMRSAIESSEKEVQNNESLRNENFRIHETAVKGQAAAMQIMEIVKNSFLEVKEDIGNVKNNLSGMQKSNEDHFQKLEDCTVRRNNKDYEEKNLQKIDEKHDSLVEVNRQLTDIIIMLLKQQKQDESLPLLENELNQVKKVLGEAYKTIDHVDPEIAKHGAKFDVALIDVVSCVRAQKNELADQIKQAINNLPTPVLLSLGIEIQD